MPYLVKEELYSEIRDYQLESIVDGDDSIVDEAIEAAILEVSDIFTPNAQKIWLDGRPHYDVAAIFAQQGSDRNSLMLKRVKTVAIWHLIGLCNTGIKYPVALDRYDRARQALIDLASGIENSATLPQITTDPPPDIVPYQSSSRPKFRHE